MYHVSLFRVQLPTASMEAAAVLMPAPVYLYLLEYSSRNYTLLSIPGKVLPLIFLRHTKRPPNGIMQSEMAPDKSTGVYLCAWSHCGIVSLLMGCTQPPSTSGHSTHCESLIDPVMNSNGLLD